MSNSYKYIDPDFTYTDPKTVLLRNLQDITDPVFEIHRHLFQDIYVWAGKKRTVEISKDGKQFFPTSHFDSAFRFIDQLIAEFKKIPKDNKKLLAEKLAEIIDNVNVTFQPTSTSDTEKCLTSIKDAGGGNQL